MRIIGMEQVINLAKMRLDIMDSFEPDQDLEKWINVLAQGLNATNTYIIKCCEEDVNGDCKVKLPCGTEELICFQFNPNGCSGVCSAPQDKEGHFTTGGVSTCTCPQVYYYDRAAMIKGGNCGWYGNYFYIQGGYMHFPSKLTATSIHIYYEAFNQDEDGLMVIDETQERGLSAGAAYQYACQKWNSYTDRQRAMLNQEWINQKNWINGKKIIGEFKLTKEAISLTVNAVLIQKQYSGIGR